MYVSRTGKKSLYDPDHWLVIERTADACIAGMFYSFTIIHSICTIIPICLLRNALSSQL